MLISYRFLPASAIDDDEDIYLARIVESHLLQYEGGYPVSTLTTPAGDMHRWHGGVHLYGGGEPVRAIADGTVVAYRFAAEAETYGSLGRYDTSFVLLRHESQTGENTNVVFYSLYMHLANQADLAADRLSQLPRWIRTKPGPDVQRPAEQRVWRKDIIGFAGQLYNREAMHFEVFMLDADFNRVWRDSKTIAQGTGSNDWFGDAHFVIPEDQPFVERHPRAPAKGPHRIDISGATDFPLPLGQAGRNAEKLYVSVTLHRGRRVARTYRARKGGGYEQVGTAVVQENYEYELYHLATALYPDCPSAGLEWLRFGRVLGPDRTTRNENWQLVRYSEAAVGYIDLAPETIAKLSDADFPHWLGWQQRDEGTTARASDGICDDAPTLALVQAARGSPDAARELQHLICKAPSEWDDADLATRYARVREPGQPLQADDNWNRFKDHVAKMAFWKAAGMTERSVWHFHPLRFIRQYRRSGWLSRNELQRLLSGAPESGVSRATSLVVAMNRIMQKYSISQNLRCTHFLAQVGHETGWWQYREEIGTIRYFRTMYEVITRAEATEDYRSGLAQRLGLVVKGETEKEYAARRPGTVARKASGMHNGLVSAPLGGAEGDGPRFRGRGFLQITGRSNYTAYGLYRQQDFISDPNPSLLATDDYNACDASGYYWAREGANREADVSASEAAVTRVGGIINRGNARRVPLHNHARMIAFRSIWKLRNDEV